MTKKAICKMQF